MNLTEGLSILRQTGALLTDGHFVYAGGRHGSTYVEMEKLFKSSKLTSEFCREIAKAFAFTPIDAITGPEGALPSIPFQ